MRDKVATVVRFVALAVWLLVSNIAAAFLIRWAVASSLGRDVGIWPIVTCIFVVPALIGRAQKVRA